jgi:DNA-binding response OmpR family regulator
MTKSRILVVDDDSKITGLLDFVLKRTERFIVRIENRSSFVRSTARDFLPSMILLDVDMPGKDGGDVAREIQADPVISGTPILFLTSLISPTESGEREILRGGMFFLAKPVNPKVLIEAVDRALAAKADADRAAQWNMGRGRGLYDQQQKGSS